MLKKILLSFWLVTSLSHAQFSVKGELERFQNYPWMVLYQLQGSQQNYIAYDSIKKGKFSIVMPTDQARGMYRLMYDVKNQAYVDFIFDNENVELTFNPKYPKESIQFSASDNNKIYQDYLIATEHLQQEIDSLQIAYFSAEDKSGIETSYQTKVVELSSTQNNYEKLASDKLANHFIKAGRRYNEKMPIKVPNDYLASVKTHYFDHIDLNNPMLQRSSFIHSKINAFLFYIDTADDSDQLIALRKESISTVLEKIGNNFSLSKDIQEGLLFAFAEQENIALVNFMLNNYLKLPREYQDNNFITDIKGQLRTSIGVTVPNIIWQENGVQKSLHKLTGATTYVIVFWSSTCGHCLQEMPLLYDYFNGNNSVQVLAVGLEDDESKPGWQTMIKQYPDFLHIYGKDKWKNTYASDYGVNATPSFYVLDAKKRVLAKPDDVKALKEFFAE